MPTYRAQVSWLADTEFPRDRFVINPHFRDTENVATAANHQGLVNDLGTALFNWAHPLQGRPLTVKLYRADDPPPNAPLATYKSPGTAAPPSTLPRELAVCLSYYSERNTGRNRGRLYIPATMLSTGNTTEAQVGSNMRQKVADLVPIFTGLGGLDIDWVVWSRADQAAKPVTNWYVDNEWDVQRRRGMPPTIRQSGTASE